MFLASVLVRLLSEEYESDSYSISGLTADLSAMQPSAESAAKIPKVEVRSSRGSGITEIQQQQVHIHPRRGGSRAGSTTPKVGISSRYLLSMLLSLHLGFAVVRSRQSLVRPMAFLRRG